MKVLNLACQLGHCFEGWFGSEDDFQDQLQRGLVTCPLCGHSHITKMPCAPRLNLKTSTAGQGDAEVTSASSSADAAGDVEAQPLFPHGAGKHLPAMSAADALKVGGGALERQGFSPEMQAVFMEALREVMARTEDVGDRFPENARRMHHGETEPRPIRGEATLQQARELLEEGIDLVPLPFLPSTKTTLQ